MSNLSILHHFFRNELPDPVERDRWILDVTQGKLDENSQIRMYQLIFTLNFKMEDSIKKISDLQNRTLKHLGLLVEHYKNTFFRIQDVLFLYQRVQAELVLKKREKEFAGIANKILTLLNVTTHMNDIKADPIHAWDQIDQKLTPFLLRTDHELLKLYRELIRKFPGLSQPFHIKMIGTQSSWKVDLRLAATFSWTWERSIEVDLNDIELGFCKEIGNHYIPYDSEKFGNVYGMDTHQEEILDVFVKYIQTGKISFESSRMAMHIYNLAMESCVYSLLDPSIEWLREQIPKLRELSEIKAIFDWAFNNEILEIAKIFRNTHSTIYANTPIQWSIDPETGKFIITTRVMNEKVARGIKPLITRGEIQTIKVLGEFTILSLGRFLDFLNGGATLSKLYLPSYLKTARDYPPCVEFYNPVKEEFEKFNEAVSEVEKDIVPTPPPIKRQMGFADLSESYIKG